MFFKVNSSRDTEVGLFRAGFVYSVDEKGSSARARKVLNAIEPMLKKDGPFQKLTKKQVSEEIAKSAVKIGPADADVDAEEAIENAGPDTDADKGGGGGAGTDVDNDGENDSGTVPEGENQ